MDEDRFDEPQITAGRLARMDPQERRRHLETKVYRKFRDMSPATQDPKQEFFGASPPSIFVGRTGYPKVNAGVMSPQEHRDDSDQLDAPPLWQQDGAPVEEVIGYRSSLTNSRKKVTVQDTDTFLDSAQEIAMASDPVDVEVSLQKKPDFELNVAEGAQPFGPAGNIDSLELAENPSVSRAVDKAVYDDDWKAEGAATYLYSKDLDTYQIQRVLSAGLLGEEDNRRLVPTRWSITATDDMVGKELRDRVQQYQEVGEHRVFTASYNGNHFHVLLIPGQWEYELIELKGSGSVWNPSGETFINAEYEGFEGRTQYASETAGAYYAARLAVLEYLRSIRRQAKVSIVREVTDEYWAPLGVWVIRETVREAMRQEYDVVQKTSEFAEHVDQAVGMDIDQIRQRSKLLNSTQSSMDSFF